eukprot:766564-Hanusia_phi.AAC.1
MLSNALPPLPRANVLDIKHDVERRKVSDSTSSLPGNGFTGSADPTGTQGELSSSEADSRDQVKNSVFEFVPSFQEIRHLIQRHQQSAFNSETQEDRSTALKPQTTTGLLVKPDANLEGVGRVTSYINGSPADLSGEIQAGDVLLAVDGLPFSHPEALVRMRGGNFLRAIGTQIRLTIQRPGHGEAFDLTLVRDSLSSVQIKKHIFEVIYSVLDQSDDEAEVQTDGPAAMLQEFASTIKEKLIDLERSHVDSLQALRSQILETESLMDQVAMAADRAAEECEWLCTCLSLQVALMLLLYSSASNQADPEFYVRSIPNETKSQFASSVGHLKTLTVMSRIAANENRLQSVINDVMLQSPSVVFDAFTCVQLQSKCKYLEEKVQEKQSFTYVTRDSEVYDKEVLDLQSDIHAHEMVTMKNEIRGLQASIQDERRKHLEEIASMKQVIWIHAIRRWLNNSCRYVMRGWFYSCQQKKATRRCGGVLKAKYSRSLKKHALSCFHKYVGREHLHQHLGVTVTSRRIFASARRWIDAWSEHARRKKDGQRWAKLLLSRRLRTHFAGWKRLRDSSDAMKSQATQTDPITSPPHPKPTLEVGCQSVNIGLSIETQCNLSHPSARKDACCQYEWSQNALSESDAPRSAPGSHKKSRGGSSSRLELDLLTEALFQAQETIKYKDELLQDAYAADMNLKNSLQNMHNQFQKAKREAEDERKHTSRLACEVERLEGRLNSLRHEKTSLRNDLQHDRSAVKPKKWARDCEKCRAQEFEHSYRIRSPDNFALQPLSASCLSGTELSDNTPSGALKRERDACKAEMDKPGHGGSKRMWILCLNKALLRQCRMLETRFRIWLNVARHSVISRRMRTNLVRRRYLSNISNYFDVSCVT